MNISHQVGPEGRLTLHGSTHACTHTQWATHVHLSLPQAVPPHTLQQVTQVRNVSVLFNVIQRTICGPQHVLHLQRVHTSQGTVSCHALTLRRLSLESWCTKRDWLWEDQPWGCLGPLGTALFTTSGLTALLSDLLPCWDCVCRADTHACTRVVSKSSYKQSQVKLRKKPFLNLRHWECL